MSQVNTSQPQQEGMSSGVKVALVVVVVLAVLYYYNAEAVNNWVSNAVVNMSAHKDAPLGGVTSGTNPAATPVPLGTSVVVSSTPAVVVPFVKTIEITKNTTDKAADPTDIDWQTFQLGEVKVYRPDGTVLKAADFDSIAYTAGTKGGYSAWKPVAWAVDGDVSTIVSTDYGAGPIHQFTLVIKDQQTISKVEILNRIDCCQARLAGVVVALKDANNNILKSQVLTAEQVQVINL